MRLPIIWPAPWLAALWLLIALPREAGAGDPAAAARAFAEGQRALVEADYDQAADRFELAHSILPSQEALRSAIRAHMQAGHLARAGALAELLLETHVADATSAGLAKEVLAEVKQKLGRVRVICTGGCTVSVDGRAVSIAAADRHVFFLPAGAHALSLGPGDRRIVRKVSAMIGATVTIEVRAPAKVEPSPPRLAVRQSRAGERGRGGLPRVVPFLGLSLTLVGAGVATWYGLETRAAHEDYAAMPDHQDWLEGRAKQRRANIMWGITAGLGAITLAAAYWTNWRPAEEAPRLGVAATDRDLMFVVEGAL